MRRAKAVFVSSYLSIASGYALWALWILASRRDAGFLGILLATLPILHLTVGNLVWNHSATTSRWLPLPSGLLVAGNLVGLLPLLPGAGTPSLWVGLAILDLGYLAYLFWYSRFPSRQGSRVQRGAPLPPFQALRHDGTRVSSLELAGSPALLIFYRGNWCPLCVTQVKDLARNYRALQERGIRVVLVSPQSAEHTASLAERFDAPMEFWIDEDLAAARALGILDAGGVPLGMEVLGYDPDTVLPTPILLDEKGIVFHDDQTDSYRIRPEPEDYLAAFDRHASGEPAHSGPARDR